jgi:hypothetical protein
MIVFSMSGITIQTVRFNWKEPLVLLTSVSKKKVFDAIIRQIPKKGNSKYGTKTAR